MCSNNGVSPKGGSAAERRRDNSVSGLAMERILERIREGFDAATGVLASFVPGAVAFSRKSRGRGPVTEADYRINRVLRKVLLRNGEGWLSEESADNLDRLKKSEVWVVDPLDGTREFIAGVPEWCVSIGWIDHGRAVAGGIFNPATKERFLGSLVTGVTYNGKPVPSTRRNTLEGATVLASRREFKRGNWTVFQNAPFTVRPIGSIAYKLALVAAGLADATWTFSPKSEWDVAAGVALVESAGGFVQKPDGSPLAFNRPAPIIPGLVAGGAKVQSAVSAVLSDLGLAECHDWIRARRTPPNPLQGRIRRN